VPRRVKEEFDWKIYVEPKVEKCPAFCSGKPKMWRQKKQHDQRAQNLHERSEVSVVEKKEMLGRRKDWDTVLPNNRRSSGQKEKWEKLPGCNRPMRRKI